MTEDLERSANNEESPDGEMTTSNEKKQKLDSKNTISGAKKFKSTYKAGMNNDQVDFASFTGRKFENTENTENNICYSGANFCWNKPCFM